MNKTYEIEYHIDGETMRRDVLTADGRTTRNNRIPVPLITFADEQARMWGAFRYQIRIVKLPHVTASGINIGITHLIYDSTIDQ